MRRLTRLRPLITALVVLLAVCQTALAQDANGPSTIITFTSSLPFISMKDAEAGAMRTVLAWHAVGLNDDERLVLERWDLDRYVSMLDEGETSLPASGERDVEVTSPSSFAPPTYRLSILDFRNRPIDQQTLPIPYIVAANGTPDVTAFDADVSGVSPVDLGAGRARVNVSWDIDNRPPTSNPVFEQVLADGSSVVIELPRVNLWIPSSGTGQVAPVADGEATEITLRLRVIDMVDGSVYAERTLTLVVGETAAPDTTGEDETTDQVTGGATVNAFSATPSTVAVGEAVSLSWDVTGATSVQISVRTDLSTEQTVIAGNLPVRAGLTIPVGADTFAGVGHLTFIIRAMDGQGATMAQERADVDLTTAPAAPPSDEAPPDDVAADNAEPVGVPTLPPQPTLGPEIGPLVTNTPGGPAPSPTPEG